MTLEEFIKEESENRYQQWDHGKTSVRDYQQVVADLVELSQQGIKLVDISLRIAASTRVLARSLREQG